MQSVYNKGSSRTQHIHTYIATCEVLGLDILVAQLVKFALCLFIQGKLELFIYILRLVVLAYSCCIVFFMECN